MKKETIIAGIQDSLAFTAIGGGATSFRFQVAGERLTPINDAEIVADLKVIAAVRLFADGRSSISLLRCIAGTHTGLDQSELDGFVDGRK